MKRKLTIKKIKKRDGRIVSFDQKKITNAIWKAAEAVGGKDKQRAKYLSDRVVEILEKKFNSGEKINPEILLEKGIIRKIKGKIPKVKILGKGEIKKSLIIEDCNISKSAKEKIEKAGGKI